MIQLIALLAMFIVHGDEPPKSIPTSEEIRQIEIQSQNAASYNNVVDELPRFVTIRYAKNYSKWIGFSLECYMPIPHRKIDYRLENIKEFKIEFMPVCGDAFIVSGMERVATIACHDMHEPDDIEFGLIEAELPIGKELIRGFRVFTPSGELIGERISKVGENIPDIHVEVDEKGYVRFENQKIDEKIDFSSIRVSSDDCKTWTKMRQLGLNGKWFVKIIDDIDSVEKSKVVVEMLLVKGFLVEKRKFYVYSASKGRLTRFGYTKD